MTLSERSDKRDACPKCGGPVTWRQVHGYPVLAQVLFGLSFVAFLIVYDQVRQNRAILYAWSVIQAGLGAWLVRGRMLAKKRVLRCIRCGADLP
jgi:peptidoglycan biosynthesis protein MviN/MurJ (putative lipid II flippase)